VLDGEIVCLDKRGRPQFRDLLFHRGEPCFYAFDLLMSDGKDIRSERLTDRKHELLRLLTGLRTSRLRYTDNVEQHGTALFQRVCEMDLEGIVAKHSLAPYTTDTTWFKIKNRSYSQMQGREELFERERHREPVAGWHSCELACAEVETGNEMTNGIVLSVLAAVAKQERITLSERTKAGLQRARRAGKRLGRRAVQVDVNCARKLQADGLGLRGIAKKLGISVNTVQRALRAVGTHCKNVINCVPKPK
jgi:ATP-dependent DNA ligase